MELFGIVRVSSKEQKNGAINGKRGVILGISPTAEGNWYAVSMDDQSWMVFESELQDTGSKAAPDDIYPPPRAGS